MWFDVTLFQSTLSLELPPEVGEILVDVGQTAVTEYMRERRKAEDDQKDW